MRKTIVRCDICPATRNDPPDEYIPDEKDWVSILSDLGDSYDICPTCQYRILRARSFGIVEEIANEVNRRDDHANQDT